jgi:GT2 family glycosyltransferase/Tfp pilus assembly protein PilF
MDDNSSNSFTSIIILTYNQVEFTKLCIQSIFRQTKKPYEIIIVDNGSTDDTVNYLSTLDYSWTNCDTVKIILNSKNAGFAIGCNQGLTAAKGSHIVFLNNDVVVTSDWISRLHRSLDRHRIDIIGPVSNHASGDQIVSTPDYDLKSLNGLDQFVMEHTAKYDGTIQQNWRLAGFCLMIKRNVITTIGGFDHRYGTGNFEDDDFCLRAHLAGFRAAIARDCYIHHFGGQTFIGNHINYHEQIKRNWELFKVKWSIPAETRYGPKYKIPFPVGGFDKKVHFVPIKHALSESMIKTIRSSTTNRFKESNNRFRSQLPLNQDIDRQCEDEQQLGGISMSIYDNVFEVVHKYIPKEEKSVAVWILERIVEYEPCHGNAHHELGLLFYELGESAKAQSHLHQAVRFSETDASIFKDLGDFFHVVHKDAEKALHYYKKAMALKPHDSSLLLTAGHFCVMRHRFDDAWEYYQRVIGIDPDNVEARECIEKIQRRRAENNPLHFSAEKVSPKASNQCENGDLYARLEQVLKDDDPYRAKTYRDRGLIAHNIGDTDPHHYSKSAELEPDKPEHRLSDVPNWYNADRRQSKIENDTLYQQAQEAAENGNIRQAIDAMLTLLINSPGKALYHNDIGVMFYKTGDKEKALNCYEQAVKLDPHNPVFQKNLADFYLMDQGRIEDAMVIYVRVLEDNPQDIDSLLASGLVCIKMDQKDDARVFFERVLEIEPWNQSALQVLDQLDCSEPSENFQNFNKAIG